MRRALAGVAVVAATALLVSACSDDGPNDQKAAIEQANPVVAATVRYTGSGFEPATVTLQQGQSITLVNGDSVDHRFRSTPDAFDSGAQRPGDQVTWTFPAVLDYQVAADGSDQHLTVKVQAKP